MSSLFDVNVYFLRDLHSYLKKFSKNVKLKQIVFNKLIYINIL